MAHAVEQHRLDRDRVGDREDDREAEDEERERAARGSTRKSRAPKRDQRRDRSADKQHQDQLRQRQHDIGRQIGPRQIAGRDELAGEQRVERESLVREERERVQRILDRVGLRPRPEQQHHRIGDRRDRQEDCARSSSKPVADQHADAAWRRPPAKRRRAPAAGRDSTAATGRRPAPPASGRSPAPSLASSRSGGRGRLGSDADHVIDRPDACRPRRGCPSGC